MFIWGYIAQAQCKPVHLTDRQGVFKTQNNIQFIKSQIDIMSDFSPIFNITNQILFDTHTDKTKCTTENTTSTIRISAVLILEAYFKE